jgi:uroporphyrinogen decarboxylase
VTSRSRVLAALNNEKPDKVPIFELWIDDSILIKLGNLLIPEMTEIKPSGKRFGGERIDLIDLYCSVAEKLGLDATSYIFSMGLDHITGDTCRDKYGTLYSLSEHGEPMPFKGPIEDVSDLKGFDMVSKLVPDDFAGFRFIVNKMGSNIAHFMTISDPFKVSWRLRGGMQNLLMDYVLRPQLVHDLARISTDFSMAAIDIAVAEGADVIVLNGDLAGESTTLMSPEHFREYIKPYEKEIVDFVHQKGAKIVKHSDGNIWSILDDFLEIGFDGIHPIQPQCMDIAKVKGYLAGRMCILGNIDCRNLLCFGTEDDVKKAVKETIRQAAQGGGYILSSSNTIHPGCKPENYIIMVEATHEYGSSPDFNSSEAPLL